MRLLFKKAKTRVLAQLASLEFTINQNTRAFKLRPERSKLDTSVQIKTRAFENARQFP